MRHYEATGSRYPLVVKLGTITPHGADVYSYASDENDMVLDPHLVRRGPVNILCAVQTAKGLCSHVSPLGVSVMSQSGVSNLFCQIVHVSPGWSVVCFVRDPAVAALAL